MTCDSHLAADEIMLPRCIVQRLTSPAVVHEFNYGELMRLMRLGQVLFVQRAGTERMRSIGHLAHMDVALDGATDCLVRHGRKYRLHPPRGVAAPSLPPPALALDDIPLPVQPTGLATPLCFGDKLLLFSRHSSSTANEEVQMVATVVDPLQCVVWPTLHPGDTVLVVPQTGDWVVVNRQPTLVQESILGTFGVP